MCAAANVLKAAGQPSKRSRREGLKVACARCAHAASPDQLCLMLRVVPQAWGGTRLFDVREGMVLGNSHGSDGGRIMVTCGHD